MENLHDFYFLSYWLVSVVFQLTYIYIVYKKWIKKIKNTPHYSIIKNILKTIKSSEQFNKLFKSIFNSGTYFLVLFFIILVSPILMPITILSIISRLFKKRNNKMPVPVKHFEDIRLEQIEDVKSEQINTNKNYIDEN